MKKYYLYLSTLLLSAFIMNYDLSLNYKTDLNQNLSDLTFQITKTEALACPELDDCAVEVCQTTVNAECVLIYYSDGSYKICRGYWWWWEI